MFVPSRKIRRTNQLLAGDQKRKIVLGLCQEKRQPSCVRYIRILFWNDTQLIRQNQFGPYQFSQVTKIGPSAGFQFTIGYSGISHKTKLKKRTSIEIISNGRIALVFHGK